MRIYLLLHFLFFSFLLITLIRSKQHADKIPLAQQLAQQIRLPPQFAIQLVAENIRNARQMALNADESVLYVGTLENRVAAVQLKKIVSNTTGTVTLIQGTSIVDIIKNEPGIDTELSGVEFDSETNTLYVSTYCCLYKFSEFKSDTLKPAKREDFYSTFSANDHHGKKYLRLTPPINGDRHMLIEQGSPCNTCATLGTPNGKLHLLNLRTKELIIIAEGVRNSYGYAFDEKSSNPFAKLFFTDNNRDYFGDMTPPCELNVIENWDQFVTDRNRKIPHFGFPFCHGDDISDDQFHDPNYQCGTGNNINYVRPYQNLFPHSAPLGLKMYRHPRLNNGKLVALFAEHGGWNTPLPTAGFRVMMVDAESSNSFSDPAKYQEFATGFVYPDGSDWQNIKGRPVDILIMKDNSVLVSDDWTGAIYRIYDTASPTPVAAHSSPQSITPTSSVIPPIAVSPKQSQTGRQPEVPAQTSKPISPIFSTTPNANSASAILFSVTCFVWIFLL